MTNEELSLALAAALARISVLESTIFEELPPQLVAIEHELTGFESATKKLLKNAKVTYKIDDKVVSEEEWNEAAGPQPKAKLGLAKLRQDPEPPVQ